MKFAASASVSSSVPSRSSMDLASLADQRWASRRVGLIRRSEQRQYPANQLGAGDSCECHNEGRAQVMKHGLRNVSMARPIMYPACEAVKREAEEDWGK